MVWIGVASYSVAALAYGVLAVIVVASRPTGRMARALLAAIVMSCLWALGLTLANAGVPLSRLALVMLDAIHMFFWTICGLALLSSPAAGKWLLGASVAAGLVAAAAALPGQVIAPIDWWRYPALVLMALIAFLTVEQVYRNAQEATRRSLKFLCLAIGCIAAVDLFVYSKAALSGVPQAYFWELRGFANAAVLPLIVLGTRKQKGWERELSVSRHVMFYTASLIGVGGYLLAMGTATYVISALGREWNFPLDLIFFAAGVGVLMAVLFFANLRAHIKTFLIKHFYRTKYDYRQAWLRLTQSLSRTGDLQQSAANGVDGLARIIGSERADLWIEKDGRRYEWLVSIGSDPPASIHFERDHPLVKFLASTGWVIDSEEYADEPDRYGTAFGHPGERLLPPDSLIVPLDRQGYLQGFVVLGKPPGLPRLNFEDHDILKTAGRQVAAVLAQALVQEQLTETRQFEALNRLSAFLMHDLKNIVAQQELVVANAQRFRHREEFLDDAFNTIRGNTDRIKKVLQQLSSASKTLPSTGRVDVSKVLMEVRSQCADRQPVPEMDSQSQPVWVYMNRDQLVSVFFHLVRNAQDATSPDGRIVINLRGGETSHVVTVTDTGCGMDEAFVRDRLFRPFDSTKGEQGMGMGAYQARHFINLAGGELDVTSRPGMGTTFSVTLPAAQ